MKEEISLKIEEPFRGFENAKEIFKPSMHVIDFGSGAIGLWGSLMATEWEIKYTGLEIVPEFLADSIDFAKMFLQPKLFQQLLKESRIRYIQYDYLLPLPPNIEKADVVVLQTPKTGRVFMENLRSGKVTQAILNALKTNGIALVFSETDTYDLEEKKTNGEAEIAFEQALKRTFGYTNVIKSSKPPEGYEMRGLQILDVGPRVFFQARKTA